jgi:hypothetical protein
MDCHPSGFRKDDTDRSRNERRDTKRRAKDAEEYKGLCANCANRQDCLMPKAEGGVWHCEEYVEEC